jgi:hypothetical protein
MLVSDLSFCQNLDTENKAVNTKDAVSPRAPYINHIEQVDSSIVINWENNYNSDLYSSYIIQISENNEKILFEWSSDSIVDQFIYTPDTTGSYQYQIFVKDSAGNVSKTQPENIYFDDGKTPVIKNIQVSPHPNRGYISLTWDTAKVNVLFYEIYRGKTKNDLDLIKSISPQDKQVFIDKDLTENGTYIYSVQYISEDGIYSSPSYIQVEY